MRDGEQAAWETIVKLRRRRVLRKYWHHIRSAPYLLVFIIEVALMVSLLQQFMLPDPRTPHVILAAISSIAVLSLISETVLGAIFRLLHHDFAFQTLVRSFTRVSRWATFPFLVLLVHRPAIVALPFFLLAITIPLCLVLQIAALLVRSKLDDRDYKNNLIATTFCLFAACLLILVPESASLLLSAAIVGGGLFLVFFTACWLLALNVQLGRDLLFGRAST